MEKSASILEFDLIAFKKQIRAQKKAILLFPIIYLIVFFLAFARNNGKAPEFYFYLITIPFLTIPGLYSPISKGVKLGKIFYAIEIISETEIHLKSFGTLWRKEKILVTTLEQIVVDLMPLPKLLYQKYLLNVVYVGNEKYYIFNDLVSGTILLGTNA